MATRGSYPHPVIDSSDDVASEFTAFNASIEVGVQHVNVTFDVRSDDGDLERLRASGRAALVARWKCSATMRAGQLSLTSSAIAENVVRHSGVLDHQELDGLVSVTVAVLAATSLDGFSFERQHPHYAGSTFDIGTGDVLAHGGDFSFDAKKMYDPLRPPLESCFRFTKRSDTKRFVKVNTSGDEFVEVSFPPVVYENFASAFAPTIQMSTVVLPALMHAIEELKRDDGPAHTPDGWRATVSRLIDDKKLAGRDTIEIAQAILDDPVADAFKQLSSMGGAYDD